jgi:RNA polymerase sigma-70 factor (ECF subfamily)
LGSEPEAQLEELHRRYAGAVFDKCLRMLGGRSEAEDAVQETFLKAYTMLDRVSDRQTPALLPWLYRIATHVCLHALRTRRRKGQMPMGDDVEQRVLVQAGQEERALVRPRLLAFLDTLDERSQAIVVGLYVDGMSQAEIAGSLGISRRAVVKRVAALRRRLEPLVAKVHEHA